MHTLQCMSLTTYCCIRSSKPANYTIHNNHHLTYVSKSAIAPFFCQSTAEGRNRYASIVILKRMKR